MPDRTGRTLTEGCLPEVRGAADERGSATLWVLTCCIVLLALGGIGLDLWRAVEARQTIAGMAEAAAAAGANALDQAAVRDGVDVVPDPAIATGAALAAVDAHPDTARVTGRDAAVVAGAVTVRVTGQFDLTLLRLIAPDDPLTVTVTAAAEARRGR